MLSDEQLKKLEAHRDVQFLRRLEAQAAEKTMARLRRDKLDSWGRPNFAEPCHLSGRLWRRFEVLDAELGVVAQMLPTGERLLTYHDVVVAEKWWGRAKRRRGAPGYAQEDEPLVEEMRAMILADPKLTPMAAAWQVAPRAKGGGTLLVKARRLRDLYGEEFES